VPFESWPQEELDKFETHATFFYNEALQEQCAAGDAHHLLSKMPQPVRSFYASQYNWPEDIDEFLTVENVLETVKENIFNTIKEVRLAWVHHSAESDNTAETQLTPNQDTIETCTLLPQEANASSAAVPSTAANEVPGLNATNEPCVASTNKLSTAATNTAISSPTLQPQSTPNKRKFFFGESPRASDTSNAPQPFQAKIEELQQANFNKIAWFVEGRIQLISTYHEDRVPGVLMFGVLHDNTASVCFKVFHASRPQ